MRIAAFVESFPEVSETFIIRQIVGLQQRGHEVDIFAHRLPASRHVHPAVAAHGLDRSLTYVHGRGVSEHPAPARAAMLAGRLLLRAPRALRWVGTRASAPYGGRRALITRLQVLATRRRYDLVHCHFGPVGLRYRFAAEHWRVPLVVSFYGHDFSGYPRLAGPRCYDPLFRAADGVIALSPYSARRLEALGCPPERLHMLALGVDTRSFAFVDRTDRPAEGPLHVLSVARLTEKKGIEHGIRAVAQLTEAGRDVQYDVIGDGPLREHLGSLVRQLNMESRVRFHGAQAEPYVRTAMARADAFLLPSITAADGDEEGTPTVLEEAASSGLPVVSTFHSGIPDIVTHGETGLLVPEGDVGALATQIRRLADDPALRYRLGSAARRRAEREFDIDVLSGALERLYAEVLDSR